MDIIGRKMRRCMKLLVLCWECCRGYQVDAFIRLNESSLLGGDMNVFVVKNSLTRLKQVF